METVLERNKVDTFMYGRIKDYNNYNENRKIQDNVGELDIREIELDELNNETIDAIKEGKENRKKGIKNLSFNDFFGDV